MNIFSSITRNVVCLSILLLTSSATFAQSAATILEEWPMTSGPADSIAAVGVTGATPTLTHFYTSTVTATAPAYSGAYGQAISPNDGLAGLGGPGDGNWKSGSMLDGPGGNLNFAYYEQFVVKPAAGYTLNIDSLYLTTAISGTPDGAYLMGYYSFTGFTLDSASLDSCSFSAPVSVPERSGGFLFVAKAFTVSGSVTVNPGDSLTLRLYYAVGSTTAGRFALLKDVIVAGTATLTPTCIAEPAAFTTYSTSVCQGASGVVYTVPNDPTATSYTWSYSGTGATFTSTTNSVSVNFSGIATSGTLSVVANAVCGSSVARTMSVTVNAPGAGAISGTYTVCQGATTTLSDAVTGGTWSSANTGIATVNSAGMVGGISSGTVAVTYSVTTGCGSFSTYSVITVNSAPSAGIISSSSGIYTVCIGGTLALNESVIGGTWSSSNTGNETVNSSGVVYGLASSGSTRITYSVTTACGSASTYSVIASETAPVITITGTFSICPGASTSLSYSGSNGGGGIWSSSNTGIATVNSTASSTGVVGGISSGSVTVSYTGMHDGCSVTAYSVVTVDPAPAIENVTSATTPGGTTTGTSLLCLSYSPSIIGVDNSQIGVTYKLYQNTTMLTSRTGTGSAVTILSAAAAATYTIQAVYTVTGCASAMNGSVIEYANPSAGVISVAPSSVCTGGTLTLTQTTPGNAPAGSGALISQYTWQGPGGLSTTTTGTSLTVSSATLSPTSTTSSGIYSLVVTYASTLTGSAIPGCTVTTVTPTSVIVSAGALPGTISGTYTVCPGATTALLDAGSSGTGTWSSGNTGIATVSTSGVVYGVTSGTVAITYSVTGGCGSSSAYSVVTVNASPSAGTISGIYTVCTGAATTLSDGAGSGTWSSSNAGIATVGSITGIVGGITSGTVAITYSVTNSCGSASAYSVVTVNPLPIAGTISGTYSVCPGTTTALSATGSSGSGTWSSSNTGIATVDAVSGLVGGVTSGTVAITYSVSNSCGSSAAYSVVTVNSSVSAGIISGVTTICPGATTTLSDGAGSGTWSSSNTGIATVGAVSGIIGGITSGTVAITYSVTNSCGTATAYSVVTVNPSPSAGTISGIYTVCPGTTTTLNDATVPGTWSSSNAGVATVDAVSGIVGGITSGTVVITYSVTNSCGTAGAFSVITVSPLPVAGIISGIYTVCPGSATTLTDIPGSGAWSSGNTGIATVGAASGIVGGITSGTVAITYSVTNSCGSALTYSVVTVNPLPLAGTISGVTTVCPGATTNLTDGTGIGTWSSSNTGIATVGAVSGTVGGIASGTVAITYSVTNSCGSASTYSVVTVSLSPSAGIITGVYSVCTGAVTTLSDGTGVGTWSSSNTGIATVGALSGAVGGILSGTVAITYSVTNSCGTATTYSVITVDPLPSAGIISGTYTVCVAATTLLTNAGNVGIGTWSSSNAAIATVNASGGVTGRSAGSADITYTAVNSCGTVSTYSVVTVSPLPLAGTISGTTSVCAGSVIILTDAGSLGAGGWSSSNTSIASVDPSGAVTGILPGNVHITYSVTNSCGTASTYSVITVNSLPVVGVITGTASVCAGSAITLSNTTSGGTWSSNNAVVATVDASGDVNGLSPGTATISYSVTNGSGCSSAVSKLITVNALPVVAAITGAGSMCVGATITLHDATSGGTWSSGDISIATVSTVGIVAGISVGNAPITYSITNSSGCTNFVTAIVPVNTSPAAGGITGAASVCIGSAILLSDTSTGGTWSSTDATVATIDGSGTLSGISAGTTTISYSVMNGCGSTSIVSTTVTVNSTVIPSVVIAVSPSNTVCASSPVTFTATAVNGGASPSITWVVNGIEVGFGVTYTYLPSNGDVVLCKLHSDATCSAVDTVLSNGITLTVDTNTVVTVSVVAYPGTVTSIGEDVIFNAIAPAAGIWSSYQWYINGVLVVGATAPTFNTNTVANNDSVSCIVATSNCGGYPSGYLIMHVFPVSVSIVNSGISDINLFPNPNKGDFTITGDLGTANDEQITLSVTNMLGQIVYKKEITARSGIINEQVSLSTDLANGIYNLSIKAGDESKTFHFVIGK